MPALPPPSPWDSLLAELLAEQNRLQTPVARFSEKHDRSATAAPALEPVYRDLIPLTAPGPGEQYAFEVDLDACTGCKACVAGCHSLNGLDDEETWRDVGLLVGGTRAHPFQQTVTTACHHCADPGCLNGCPVLAYEKDPITGIVRHLDDQCIGCQYCVLKCPYDVPKYNERLGIVRKCDMCQNRLSAGEAPACVQSCPTQAISIVTVTTHVGGKLTPDTSTFLPAAPAPDYTLPTTRYVSKRPLPAKLTPADAAALRPQPPHWPLVFMLTLIPMAVGCVALSYFIPGHAAALTWIGWFAAATGLGASVFHLGQPLRAWRIFLGLRRSWLSREAVVFGPWFGLVTVLAFAGSIDDLAGRFDFAPLTRAAFFFTAFQPELQLAATALGLVGLFCSAMIYVDTCRELWRAAQTLPRFFGAALVLGGAALFALAPTLPHLLVLLSGVLLKLAVEVRVLRPLDNNDESPTDARKTAQLLTGPLRTIHSLRIASALLAAGPLALLVAGGQAPVALAWLVTALLLTSEFAERYLYFRAVVAPKMPGVVSQ
jgi:Fe-S-cluster-containing dehydrogenase component/DMSO reductase anchor subunit